MGAKVTRTGNAAQRLRQIRRNLEDKRAVLETIGQVIVESARVAFLTGTDPDTGSSWPRLAKSTLARPGRISSQPLLRTGRLFDSLRAKAPRGNQVAVRHLWYGIFPREGHPKLRNFMPHAPAIPRAYQVAREFVSVTLRGLVYKLGDGL